ncbi:MAG: response regulator transcription factor [Spirochaetales bacterium]|nr:response regulator transcription factor [Spirochaetales bacterium]
MFERMPYTILLVDDDTEFRQEFKDLLEEYNVIEASNGQAALDILNSPNTVDLVILDVMMPGLKGTEVLKQIKSRYPDLSIIISTAYSSKDVAIESLRAHADDYLEKPFQVHRAKAVIRRLLEGKLLDDDSKGIIEKVKAYTERNFQKNVSLNDVASFVALSPKYLSRLFKAATGTGFNEYKIELKINKGKELLRTTALNINQITDELGYLNTESFIRIFKKVTGETPTEFRARRS